MRALRPLRALKRVPGMPVLVQSILGALPRVGNVLMLCGFIFLVFAIVGVETFKGQLHYRCALPGFSETVGHPTLADVEVFMSPVGRMLEARVLKGSSGGGGGGWGPQAEWDTKVACNPLKAGLGSEDQCSNIPGSSCRYFDMNPMHNLMSFDNVGVSMITLLQGITFDDWTVAM